MNPLCHSRTFGFWLRRAALHPAVVLCGLLAAAGAAAQSSCSSDGVAPPAAWVERFTSAACARCWSDPGLARVPPGAVAIDWIVPAGNDAPLAAAATRDAFERLQALSLQPPAAALTARTRGGTAGGRLRLAHGLAVGDYIGASIAWWPAAPPPAGATVWLLLVEALPAGTVESPVARNLVRNVLVVPAFATSAASLGKPAFTESRSLQLPEGARRERLRLVGWVQDAQGRMLSTAQTRCVKAAQMPRVR